MFAKWFKPLFITALMPFLTSHAKGGVIERISVAGWEGAAYTSETGRFSHCAVSAKYKSGIELIFSVSDDYSWRIGFVSDAFNMTKGQSIDITYFIDTNRPRFVHGRAISKTSVVVELPSTTEVFDQFRSGKLLNVIAVGRSLGFNLDGTHRALSELIECISRNKGRAGPADGNRTAAATPAQTLEAVKFVANVFAGNGFEGYRILTEADLKKQGIPQELKEAAVTWVGPDTLGTLHIMPKGLLTSAADAMPYLISADSKSCEGKFGSGSSSENNNKLISRFFTLCSPSSGRPYSIFYTIVRLADETYYRIGSMSFDTPDAARSADETIGQAALTILR